MRTHLTLAHLGDFLDQPIVAVLATYRADGSVMLSPVWHEYRDGAFAVWCGSADEGKVRHVIADPRASLVVAEQTMPYRGVEVSGTATATGDDFRGVLRRTASRYRGPETASAYDVRYRDGGVVIRVRPGRLRIWDFRDET